MRSKIAVIITSIVLILYLRSCLTSDEISVKTEKNPVNLNNNLNFDFNYKREDLFRQKSGFDFSTDTEQEISDEISLAPEFSPEYFHSDPDFNEENKNNQQAKNSNSTYSNGLDSGLEALSATIGELFEDSADKTKANEDAPLDPVLADSGMSNPNLDQDLREIFRSFGGGGGSSNSNIDNDSNQRKNPTPTPSPSPTPDGGLPWVTGQTRGYTALYTMEDKARQTVEAELNNLLTARLRKVYWGVLIDGTFGWDPDYLGRVITALSSDNRQLTLVIYITNGPTMRNFDSTPIKTDFSRIDPKEFRDLIQSDPNTRETYKKLLDRAALIFSFSRRVSENNYHIVIPMLEDNLDQASYVAMSQLTEEKLSGLAEIRRNPCPGCYSGNDTSRNGGALELHGLSDLPLGQRNDSYSLDGSGYHLANESPFRSSLSVNQTLELIDITTNMSFSYFGLWRADRQGLFNGTSVHPNERNYAIPSEAHLKFEIELLRHGLEEVPQEDSTIE